jgi:hypothetical protein
MHERAIPIAAEFEIRSTADGHQFEGYAAVFGAQSSPLPYTETVQAGAFARSLQMPPNGRQTFTVDHDDTKLLSSTRTGNLHLSEDSHGLHVESNWPDTSYARDVRELHEANELGGMSFEFSATAKGAPFSSDKKSRNIREAKLYNVTVLTGKTPAYSATTAGFRALGEQLGATFDDVVALFDAIREGRKLTVTEHSLLIRAVLPVVPYELRYSGAAWDASSAAYSLAGILSIMSDEAAEADQLAMLKTAADAMQQFITAEAGEVGGAQDALESGYAQVSDVTVGVTVTSNSRPNLAEARELWPTLHTANN